MTVNQFNKLNLKPFFQLLLVFASGLGLVFFAEKYVLFSRVPRGSFICTFEFFIEFCVFLYLIKNRSRFSDHSRKFFLPSFFIFVGIGDISYLILNYSLKVPTNSYLSLTFTTLAYTVGYLFAGFGMLNAGIKKKNLIRQKWLTLLPLGIIIPVFLKILLPALKTSFETNGLSSYLVFRLANTSASIVLMYFSIIVMVASRSFFWSLFAVGTYSLVLTNWALGAEILIGTPISAGFYEFAWASCIITCSIASLGLVKDGRLQLQVSQKLSLLTQYRLALTSTTVVALVIASFIQPFGFSAYRVALVGLSFSALAAIILSELMVSQIKELSTKLSTVVSEAQLQEIKKEKSCELPVELNETFEIYFADKARQSRIQKDLDARFVKLAKQVAHDIRAPVAALKMILVDSKINFGEEEEKLINYSIERINGIANDLLATKPCNEIQSVELTDLLSKLVTEKQMQYARSPHVTLKCEVSTNQKDRHPVKINIKDFRRILSNIIDNGVEALSPAQTGLIKIGICYDNNFAHIAIRDNGCGISKDLMAKIGTEGFTVGKAKGSGLGIFHAKEIVNAWGGKLSFWSEPGAGTEVTISVPI